MTSGVETDDRRGRSLPTWSSLKPYAVLVLLNLAATLATFAVAFVPWGGAPAPGLSLIHRYWDGPSYAGVAHSLYDPNDRVYTEVFGIIVGVRVVLPVYPLTIRALAPIFGYLDGMLVATFLFACALSCILYRTLKEFRLVAEPLWCAALFVFFPPRWVIYHAVGASEPPFILFILCAFYFYRKRSLALCGLFAGLATVTRIYGLLLLPAFLLAELSRGDRSVRGTLRLAGSLLPIPLFIGAHFAFLRSRVGTFWAYFDENAEHLTWIPFRGVFEGQLFRGSADVYGTTAILFMAVTYGLTWLWQKGERDMFFIAALLTLPNVFTTLGDVPRYMAPVYPFALLVPFSDLLSRREVKGSLFVYLPATYAYVWSSILVNVLPMDVYARLRAVLESAP